MRPLITINNHAIISIHGADSAQFLQSQLSCDINSLSLGKASWASYCNRKGQVIAFGLLIRVQESHFFWLVKTENCSATEQILKRYQLNRKLSIKVESTIRIYLCSEEYQLESRTDSTATICTIPYLNSHQLLTTTTDLTTQEVDLTDLIWNKLWVDQRIADIYGACREHYHPIELNYPAIAAVNFEKGCYIGQEIVSRLYHRAQGKTKIYAINTQMPLPYGELLFADPSHHEELGQVLNGYTENGSSKTLVLFDRLPEATFYQQQQTQAITFDYCQPF